MPRRQFNTIPEELLDLAENVYLHYQTHGYSISIEKTELGFPYTPALLCKRQRTTIVVEVDSKVKEDRIRRWVDYGRSAGQDFRISLFLPNDDFLKNHKDEGLRALGVGCYVQRETRIIELCPPNDLAMNVVLPTLKGMPTKVRSLLGPAYEQFERTQWREGFETACQAFEDEARKYLKRHLRSHRIKIVGLKKNRQPSISEINGLTMGSLAKMFSRIQNQNKADSDVYKALSAINRDRIGVVHKRNTRTTERHLRVNVGRHMWSLVAALIQAVK